MICEECGQPTEKLVPLIYKNLYFRGSRLKFQICVKCMKARLDRAKVRGDD